MDGNAIPLGLVGMTALRTDQCKDGVAVPGQTLGKVNSENRLSMEGDILRSFCDENPHYGYWFPGVLPFCPVSSSISICKPFRNTLRPIEIMKIIKTKDKPKIKYSTPCWTRLMASVA